MKKQSMVSYHELSPLKGSKHSKQCHPHDAVLVNALSFVSMGVEARCCPCHSVDIGLVEKPFQHTCLYHLQDCVVNGD
jgi:hypothetical protein